MIASIERATLAAVPPDELREQNRWLIGLDAGSVNRSRSAAPLSHSLSADQQLDDEIDHIITIYQTHQLPPAFRLAQNDGLAAARAKLESLGFRPIQPTCVQVSTVDAALAGLANMPSSDAMFDVRVDSKPDQGWADVFLGLGFDPIDGAHRIRILSRAVDAVFATVMMDGQAVACGTASFGYGWASWHGMRTLAQHRGRGLASSVLYALAQEAQQREMTQVFLQVEQANETAQRLYQRLGFTTAWVYDYWRR